MAATRTARPTRTASAAARGPKPQQLRVGRDGWLSVRQAAPPASEHELLVGHADWSGPVKLEREHGEVVQHWTACLRPATRLCGASAFDEEAQAREQKLIADLQPLISESILTASEDWEPPAAATLVEWLATAGHDAQIDDAGNLRLVVKRRGCDGQIRVERRTGRLRFVLPLGSWPVLSEEAQRAMWPLADEANARTRLARVAWFDEPQRSRCEGQVDLTGLPTPDADSSERVEFWRNMVSLAVDALEVLLRRLGLELDVLANDHHHAVREWMHAARSVL